MKRLTALIFSLLYFVTLALAAPSTLRVMEIDYATPPTNLQIPYYNGTTVRWVPGPISSVLDDDLDAIAALTGTGIACRTAADTWALRTLTAPAAGFTIANPAGVAGDPTFALANDLSALEALATTGLVSRTGSETYSTRTITAPAAGITVSNGDGVSGNPTLALADDLAGLEGMSATGYVARTASNTYANRTFSSSTLTVTNGDGVSGNTTTELGTQLSGLQTQLNLGLPGLIARSGASSYAMRSIAVPTGMTIANGDGLGGNPTISLADDLAGLEAMSGTGLVARTAANTYAQRTLTAPAAGITVSNGDGVAGNPTLALADDLSGLEGMSGTGLVARTAANTYAQRTITGTSNQITVTNGDGVSADPTVSLPNTIKFTGSGAISNSTSDASDTGELHINAGGAASLASTTRGAGLSLYGNESAGVGSVTLESGNVSSSSGITIYSPHTASGIAMQVGSSIPLSLSSSTTTWSGPTQATCSPTISASTGSLSTSSTVYCNYFKFGKWVWGNVSFTADPNSDTQIIRFTVPSAGAATGSLTFFSNTNNAAGASSNGVCFLNNGSSTVDCYRNDASNFTAAGGLYTFFVSFHYLAAS